MANADAADFLVEIGTEELPPKALEELQAAFARLLGEGLERERLPHARISAYASPRRLAVLASGLAAAQADRELLQRGPPVSVAYDADGLPTPAARAFAAKCGVSVDTLDRTKTAKGEWLSCRTVEAGRSAADLLPGIVRDALDSLPIPRRMRWGAAPDEFVRPVHWILMLHGEDVVEASILGVKTGRLTRGHRFLSAGTLSVRRPADYLQVLEQAFVLADFARRRQLIVNGVQKAAAAAGGVAIAHDDLYDEVAALTEWPVPLTGRFAASFLSLPREVIVATLTSHQRYFPIEDEHGKLMGAFVTVANLQSKEPDRVRDGNERVVRPRLADAAFFWDQDRKLPLEAHRKALDEVIYQQGLGSIGDRSARLAGLSVAIAGQSGFDRDDAERAALLSKCDLLTGMVGEFPELQGVMGRYYATASGEPAAVADGIGEQYLPRFAGDMLPETSTGQILAIADKLDALAGAFCLGRKPSGNRDPFGLRRAALGVVRIAVEKRLDLDLPRLIEEACKLQPMDVADARSVCDDIFSFILERMRAHYVDQLGLAPEVFEAVRARQPASLADFDSRVRAVSAFVGLDAAASLAASNKRIANILRQAGGDAYGPVDAGMLEDAAESRLYEAIVDAKAAVAPLLEKRAYEAVLARLAGLRPAIDTFFDDVMVMTDDQSVRRNRLALLSDLRALFLDIADISRLSIGGAS
jgi:glycyl-tRNA synthetase beta chain